MSVWKLIVREILHRKGTSSLAVVSVVIAVGTLIGAVTILDADQRQTRRILEAQQEQVKQAGVELNDAMRKITKGLGFNILVLPEAQDLNELHRDGAPSRTMPEEYVSRLANSKIVTINHLLPIVSKRHVWEELQQTVILTGTRGEVPLQHRALKKPLQDQVPAGTMVVGYNVHSPSNPARPRLTQGEMVTLMGRDFRVTKLQPERGTQDDITVWINLAEAQEMLGLQNLVHAVLALECNCAAEDRVAEIREEIAGILPGTQVVERGSQALARAETRNKAKQTAEENLARAVEGRKRFQKQREDFAALLVPMVVFGCVAWVGLLAMLNVRERTTEIGMLRAIGLRSSQIMTVILGKAAGIGLTGACLGCICGLAIGIHFGEVGESADAPGLVMPGVAAATVFATPLLTMIASWIPALLAARQDPATVLAAG